ncbi:hypothetical protein [Faucicola atlantae]|uniref:hypothetical protein n=1 Tax=Faucicola atlantae TaxID=34059 RepID=UPI0025B116DE|nr:hypothetical protein [Moraxella atlantae]
MKPTPTIRVWLGGSFDPVHVGHVAMLQHVHQRLRQAVPDLPIVASFLPTAGSPLKVPAQRLMPIGLPCCNLF